MHFVNKNVHSQTRFLNTGACIIYSGLFYGTNMLSGRVMREGPTRRFDLFSKMKAKWLLVTGSGKKICIIESYQGSLYLGIQFLENLSP